MKSVLACLCAVLFSCIASAYQSGDKYHASTGSLLGIVSLAGFLWTTQSMVYPKIRRCMDLPSEDEREPKSTFSKDKQGARDQCKSPDESVRQKGGGSSDASSGSDDNGKGGEDKEEAEKVDYYQMMVTYLQDQLENIGEVLEKKRIRLILVFDLDGTLYLPPANFSEKMKGQLDEERLFRLQQQWLFDFAGFMLKYRANLVLIYNTARTYTEDSSITQAGYVNPAFLFESGESGEVADSLMRFQPHNELGYQEQFGVLGIPKPDVFITDYGRYVHLSEAFKQHVDQSRLKKVRQKLNQEYFHTTEEANALVARDFRLMYYIFIAHHSAIGHSVYVQKTSLHRQAFEEELYLRQRRTAICPNLGSAAIEGDVGQIGRELAGFTPQSRVIEGNNIYYSSVANKGSALCLMLELLEPYLESDGFSRENIWEVVFGDSCPDLAMMRPDLEVRSFSIMPDDYMKVREETFKEIGFMQDFREPPYWKLSVVYDKWALGRRHGDHVKESVSHGKVEESKRLGLLGFLRPLLDQLDPKAVAE